MKIILVVKRMKRKNVGYFVKKKGKMASITDQIIQLDFTHIEQKSIEPIKAAELKLNGSRMKRGKNRAFFLKIARLVLGSCESKQASSLPPATSLHIARKPSLRTKKEHQYSVFGCSFALIFADTTGFNSLKRKDRPFDRDQEWENNRKEDKMD